MTWKNLSFTASVLAGLALVLVFGMPGIGSAEKNGQGVHANSPNEKRISITSAGPTLPSWWHLLDVLPLETGSPVSVSGSFFEVGLDSDTLVILDDFTTSGVWAQITDLGGSNHDFSFTLDANDPNFPTGWHAPGTGPSQPLPGSEGDLKFVLPRSATSAAKQATFTYQVDCDQYAETLDLSFTLAWLPQISTTGQTNGNATVEGTITDTSTNQPVSGAQITLWLGFKTTLMPYDMVMTTDASGFYRLACWDTSVLNSYYSPHLTIPGYVMMVQKQGYQTYVHSTFVNPRYGSPITLNASLTPLDDPVDFELQWETSLSSPGVWGIAVSDAWNRFAVAMGKHPDPNDPATLPTSIPFIDGDGTILWTKSLADQSWSVDVTSNGSHVACATHASGQNYHYLWDASGNEVWKKAVTSLSTDIRFSPNNQYVASGPSSGGESFILYDTLTGTEAWTCDTGLARVRQTAFTADSQHILLGAPIHKYTVGGTQVWRRNEDTGLPYVIRPSTDKSRIFVPDKGGCASMFDANGALLWRKEHRVTTYGGMSADGSVAAVLSHNGNLYCYNGAGVLQWHRFVPGSENGAGAGHDGLDMTPDGQYIAIGGGRYNTVLYDSQGNVLWRHTGTDPGGGSAHPYWSSVMNVRISQDGDKIVSGYGTSNPKLCYFEKVPATSLCPDCSGPAPLIQNVTFPKGCNCTCIGDQSITLAEGVTIEAGATVVFRAPIVRVESGFHAESDSVVEIKQK